ncbi:hypothetical protein ACPA9J_35935 [Pseudomonas aeruginosa]
MGGTDPEVQPADGARAAGAMARRAQGGSWTMPSCWKGWMA